MKTAKNIFNTKLGTRHHVSANHEGNQASGVQLADVVDIRVLDDLVAVGQRAKRYHGLSVVEHAQHVEIVENKAGAQFNTRVIRCEAEAAAGAEFDN